MDPFVTSFSDVTGFGLGESAAYASGVSARQRKPTVSSPRVESQAATSAMASELQVEEGTTVVSRHQRRFIDGTPYSMQTTFYPMRYVARGRHRHFRRRKICSGGVVSYLEQKLQIKEVGWTEKYRPAPPILKRRASSGFPTMDGSP